MGNTTAILVAIGVTVPLAALLIYFGFRNLFKSIRNVKKTIDVVAASDPASEITAYLQQQAKKSDDAHKAKIRAHVERPVPPVTLMAGRQSSQASARASPSSMSSRRDCHSEA